MSEENKASMCPCGGIILADTEDWPVPLCYECYPKHLVDANEKLAGALEFMIQNYGSKKNAGASEILKEYRTGTLDVNSKWD